MKKREQLSSRIGFIFLSAACAIGLGNVWRFPFVAGKYGGAAFVLLYAGCLALLGFPLLVMELAVGRGGRRNLAGSMAVLSPHKWWRRCAKIVFVGNLLLMMYYTTVSGWLAAYFFGYFSGTSLQCATPEASGAAFGALCASPLRNLLFTGLVILAGAAVCAMGLKDGVERFVKWMMYLLLAALLALACRGLLLPGAGEALKFYLVPDFTGWNARQFFEALYAAWGQSFFTLSIGIGAMAIFGSYIERDNTLTGDALWIVGLDTFVALVAGLVIFPVCFSFGTAPGQGPGLIFVTLPQLFCDMPGGRYWGGLFFFFMLAAALTTVIAVFENMVAYLMDQHHIRRVWAATTVGIGVFILSLPCLFGFNIWSGIQPLGEGSTILDAEDFIVSQNLLPLGALLILLFCTSKTGWGFDAFLKEADTGSGMKFPACLRGYLRYILPLVLIGIFLVGYYSFFFAR